MPLANVSSDWVSGGLVFTGKISTTDIPAVSFYDTAVAPANSYGLAAYFESDVSGTQSGEFVYGMGSWINLLTGTVGAGKYLCAQDNGIYEEAAATVTNALVIFGMRMEKIMSDTDAKTFPFSINTNNAAITALFDCQTMTDFGITSGHSTGSNQIPFARDANGTVYYMNVYT